MKFTCLFLLSTLCAGYGYAQGCSDAGFCSLGVLKNNVTDSSRQRLSIGLNYGFGELKTGTTNAYAEYGINISNRVSLQAKLTATYATGFLGSNFGLGDIYGTVNYSAVNSGDHSLNFLGGIKVPLSRGNDKNADGKPLPLDYQAGIGTYDAIGGLNYIINKRWEFDAGVQIPVVQINESTYFPNLYTDTRALGFPATNKFRRKSDVLGRVGYYIQSPGSTITIKPSLLGIYHLGEDTYQDNSGKRLAIDRSQGITLNWSIAATKQYKNGNSLELLAAAPFVTRKVRPDGLTRHFVINLQYTFAL